MAEQQTPPGPDIPFPELDVVAEMHMGIGNRLLEIQQDKQAGRPIVWGSLITPKEILYAMDVPVIFQEILGAWVSIMIGSWAASTLSR